MHFGLGLFEIYVELIFEDDERILKLALNRILNCLTYDWPTDFEKTRNEMIDRLRRVDEFKKLNSLIVKDQNDNS